ncbi:hypothetical protein J5N97_005515 [Dioscorea zingiberensis]|uniref:Uncharacterized protein n=1 Tax=Dioscorea zingiberensis TaxID=325984 RepID=A0A9D5D9Y2_9LILI|nr:hypothetical protein J5N97_005515 [Dioscorea zingiberensis]
MASLMKPKQSPGCASCQSLRGQDENELLLLHYSLHWPLPGIRCGAANPGPGSSRSGAPRGAYPMEQMLRYCRFSLYVQLLKLFSSGTGIPLNSPHYSM